MEVNVNGSMLRILIGLFISIFAYSELQIAREIETFRNDTNYTRNIKFENRKIKAQIEKSKLDFYLLTLQLAKKHHVTSPYSINNDLQIDSTIFRSIKNGEYLLDLAKPLQNFAATNDTSLAILQDNIEELEMANRFSEIQNIRLENLYFYNKFSFQAILFLITLLLFLEIKRHWWKPLKENRCQSCSRAFDSIIRKGTEIDKTVNNSFCIDCYRNGIFTDTSLSKQEAYKIAKSEFLKSNLPYKLLLFKHLFRNLDRWRNDRYKLY